MRDTAGELPDGVELLGLEQLGERGLALAGPLLDALLELIVEHLKLGRRRLEFGCPLGDASLELGVQRSSWRVLR